MTPLTDDEAVELLHEMLAIPSPSGQEQDLAAFLAARLSKLGFAERIDAAAAITRSGVSRLIVPTSSLSPNTPHAAPAGAPARTGSSS